MEAEEGRDGNFVRKGRENDVDMDFVRKEFEGT
jgi:hypothetical protein